MIVGIIVQEIGIMNNLLVYALLIRLDHKYINELSSRDDFNNWFFMLNFVLFLFCFVYVYIFKERKKKGSKLH